LGDAKAIELDSTPASLTQWIAFVREVRDDLVEAEKLQQTVVFNLEHRKQERWEFFIRNDNEAFTQQIAESGQETHLVYHQIRSEATSWKREVIEDSHIDLERNLSFRHQVLKKQKI